MNGPRRQGRSATVPRPVSSAERPGAPPRVGVQLMVSGRCNLACSYCYQDRRRVRAAMGWGTARAALDEVLAGQPEELGVEFSGGEPLLEPALIRRAVAYVERRRGDREVLFVVTTNGTLLTRELLDYFVEHGCEIRLSFDGVAAAQDLRSPGTFAVLDRLLDLLREEYPAYYRESVDVGVTLNVRSLPHLAESVRYLLAKDLANIGIAPQSTWEADWGPGTRDALQAQVDEILEDSLRHWTCTGRVPLKFLSPAPTRSPHAPAGDFLCGSVRGEALVVDPDGHTWACPVFAASVRDLPPLAAEASRVLGLGDVRGGGLRRRMRRLPGRALGLGVFTNKRAKRSSYGRCRDCRFLAECYVCPAAICSIPDNADPNRVPDFVCAFNQVTLQAHERFDEMTGGRRSAEWFGDVREMLRGLGDTIEDEGGRRGAEPGVERRHTPIREGRSGLVADRSARTSRRR